MRHDVYRRLAQAGTIEADTREADHEAGDPLQAGLVRRPPAAPADSPVFFKRCGRVGWALAAARCMMDRQAAGGPPASRSTT